MENRITQLSYVPETGIIFFFFFRLTVFIFSLNIKEIMETPYIEITRINPTDAWELPQAENEAVVGLLQSCTKTLSVAFV